MAMMKLVSASCEKKTENKGSAKIEERCKLIAASLGLTFENCWSVPQITLMLLEKFNSLGDHVG
jgi:hypothetical protein